MSLYDKRPKQGISNINKIIGRKVFGDLSPLENVAIRNTQESSMHAKHQRLLKKVCFKEIIQVYES